MMQFGKTKQMRIIRRATLSESEDLSNKNLVLPQINSGIATDVTSTELDVIHDSGVTNADLVKLHAVTITAANINYGWSDEFAIIYADGIDNSTTLPQATGSGRKRVYTKLGAGELTVAAYSGDTIQGEESMILVDKDTMTIHDSDTGLWVIV